MRFLRIGIFILITIAQSLSSSADIIDLLPIQSEVLNGYNRDSVVSQINQAPRNDIVGIWQFVDSGAEIVIEQFTPNNIPQSHNNFYRIVILKASSLSIEPGTVMGYITITSKRNKFDARIYTEGGLSGILSKPKNFTLTLTDDQFLEFSQYKKQVKVDLWRWLPYIYRVRLSIKDTRPKGLDGCIKIYPQPKTKPLTPRYL